MKEENSMSKRRTIAILLVVCIFLFNGTQAFAWSVMTHYYINSELASSSSESYRSIYASNGTGPDMFGFTDFADYVHSPDEARKIINGRITYPYINFPNFAYIMEKVAAGNNVYSLGWGGHIAADWVAHNEKLFKIPLEGDHGLVYEHHIFGETCYDIYMYLSRGRKPIDVTTFKFSPKRIYKALVNYEMIRLHELDLSNPKISYSDSELKELAIDSVMSESKIKNRCKNWNKKANIIMNGELAYLDSWDSYDDEIFLYLMNEAPEGSHAEDNINLSKAIITDWNSNKTPRGHIPDVSAKVKKFKNSLYDFLPNSGNGITAATITLSAASYQYGLEEDNFWEEVSDKAEAAGIIVVSDETVIDENGEEIYIVKTNLTDKEHFKLILRGVIEEHIKNPSSDFDLKFACFYKNLFEGCSDIFALTERIPPTITGLTPANGSFTNNTAPTISATVQDNEGGIGVDFEHIKLEIDGEIIEASFDANTGQVSATPKGSLPEGEHSVSLVAFDKAGNEAEKTWKFTVDTIPPELTHDVINKIINVKKNTVAAIELISNEPITFRAEIFRVKDKQTGNKGEKVYTYTYQELTQEFTFFWGGRNDEGNLVPGGVYTVKITAADRAANETTFEAQVNVNNEAGK